MSCSQDDKRRSVPHSEAHDATATARYPMLNVCIMYPSHYAIEMYIQNPAVFLSNMLPCTWKIRLYLCNMLCTQVRGRCICGFRTKNAIQREAKTKIYSERNAVPLRTPSRSPGRSADLFQASPFGSPARLAGLLLLAKRLDQIGENKGGWQARARQYAGASGLPVC